MPKTSAGSLLVLLPLTLTALVGCGDGGPAGPNGGSPLLMGIAPSSANPLESPLLVTLTGTGLEGVSVEGPPTLFLERLGSSDTEIRLRVGFRGGPAGEAWIRAVRGAARDSIAFTVLPLSWGDSLTETRALWVSRFEYGSPEDLAEIMARAAAARFNVVYLQVRGRADAFYRSSHEPWAANLSGILGEDPGWDPLATALEEAQRRGMELHAWLNAFTGWAGSVPPPLSQPPHAFLAHPDWVMVAADGTPMAYTADTRWLTPGHPGVRSRLAAVAADVARRYPVDGIHLDFIRYPGTAYSYDAPALAAYDSMKATEPALGFDEARRRFVTWAVAETRDSLAGLGREVELSAAVWGIFQNKLGWSGVSTGFESVLQDARSWDRLGIVDALVPMVYWPIAEEYGGRLDFAWLADEHAGAVSAPVFVGAYVHGLDGRGLAQQVERARMAGAEGISLFSYSGLEDGNLWGPLATWAFHWPARRGP